MWEVELREAFSCSRNVSTSLLVKGRYAVVLICSKSNQIEKSAKNLDWNFAILFLASAEETLCAETHSCGEALKTVSLEMSMGGSTNGQWTKSSLQKTIPYGWWQKSNDIQVDGRRKSISSGNFGKWRLNISTNITSLVRKTGFPQGQTSVHSRPNLVAGK